MAEKIILKQLSFSDWIPFCSPVWLCSLPLRDKKFSEITDIQFEEYLEDGLGRVLGAVCEIGGSQLFLKSCIDGPDEAKLISVNVHGHETEWEKIKLSLCSVLSIDLSDIPMEQSELQPGRWILSRLDDNGNEVEMYRFPDRHLAEQAQRDYENRGHKQDYYVRAAT